MSKSLPISWKERPWNLELRDGRLQKRYGFQSRQLRTTAGKTYKEKFIMSTLWNSFAFVSHRLTWHQTPKWIVSQISMSRSSWRMINKVGNVWDSTTLISEMNIKIVVLCFLHVSLDTRILLDFFWIKNSNKPCSNLGHYLKFKCISTTKSPIHHLIWRGNTSKSIKTPPTNFTCVF